MDRSRLVVALVVLPIIASCTTTPPAQRRWGKLVGDDERTPISLSTTMEKPVLGIGAYGSDSPALSVKDLPDHAAASYITALAKNPKLSPEAFRASIGKTLSAPKPLLDTTSLDRTLVITVSKQGFAPADRLVRTEIEITPAEGLFRFSDYAAAATTYSSINIETLGATRGASNGIEFDPTFAGLLQGSAKLTSGNSESYTDQASVTVQNEQLTVYKKDESLVVYRESERNIDLTGSTLVKLSMHLENKAYEDSGWVVTDEKLFDDDGKPLPPNKASVTLKMATFAKPKPIVVKGVLHYVLRHVVSGADTYNENDDTVRYVSGSVDGNFTLVPATAFDVPRWQIKVQGLPVKLTDITGPKDHAVPFVFLDYDDALAFVRWRQYTSADAVGPNRLVDFNDAKLPSPTAFQVEPVAKPK